MTVNGRDDGLRDVAATGSSGTLVRRNVRRKQWFAPRNRERGKGCFFFPLVRMAKMRAPTETRPRRKMSVKRVKPE